MISCGFQHSAYCYPDAFKEIGERFFGAYAFVQEVGCPETRLLYPNVTGTRKCRLCQQTYPATTFRNEAHFFPEFLGNKTLISSVECDRCNAMVAHYEHDFANFLGFTRTIQSVKKKKGGFPVFISPDKAITAVSKQHEADGITVDIERGNPGDSSFQYDENRGLSIIEYLKLPYTPLKIYKFLLKIGLSVIDNNEVTKYQRAFSLVASKKLDNDPTLEDFAIVHYYDLPFTVCLEKPLAFLFKKRNRQDILPTHILLLYTLNLKIQVQLPYYLDDYWLYKNETRMGVPVCPPIFGYPYHLPAETIQSRLFNFSANVLRSNERAGLSFPMTKNEHLKMMGDGSMSDIKGITLQRRPLDIKKNENS
jgi:HNH endonuclease